MFGNQQHIRAPAANYYEMGENSSGAHGGAGDIDDKPTNLIVNYIPQNCTEEDLSVLFSEIGDIETIRIMRDYKTGYSFGFGFVKYFKPEDAIKAIETLNGLNYWNKRLKVSYARPPGEDNKDTNLYVTNLPRNVTEQDLEEMFGEFGEIIQKTVLKDKITGMPRGVAFVRYSKRDEAQNAIAGLDGRHLAQCMEPLSVKIAENHGKQKAQYIEGYNTALHMGYHNPPMRGGPMGGRGGRGRGFHHGGYRTGGGGGGGGGDNRFYNQNMY